MKTLFTILIILTSSIGSLQAQFAIGISYGNFWSKGKIDESNDPEGIFKNNASRNTSTNYSISYSFKNRINIGLDIQSLKYKLNVSSIYGTKSSFSYSPGIFLIPNLNLRYKILSDTKTKLSISTGIGIGVFCSACTKNSEPYYPKKGFTSKSSVTNYSEGVYFNNWESEYRKKYIATGNLFLKISYPIWEFHVFSIEGQFSKGSTWSSRHIVHYENNGITPGHDQYESSYITIEQQHLFWAINLKYELKLNFIPLLWKKVATKESSQDF